MKSWLFTYLGLQLHTEASQFFEVKKYKIGLWIFAPKIKILTQKGMSSTFPKVRKMCFPNFRKIFSENFPNFRKIFSFFPKVRKNIFRKFGKIKFRCSHLLSILVRFLSQSSLSKTNFYQFHSQFGSYENQNGSDASIAKYIFIQRYLLKGI